MMDAPPPPDNRPQAPTWRYTLVAAAVRTLPRTGVTALTITLLIALALLVGCSHSSTPAQNQNDADVCKMVLAEGIPNREAWKAIADPDTQIGQAAIAAANPSQGAMAAYNSAKTLTDLCVAAGYRP